MYVYNTLIVCSCNLRITIKCDVSYPAVNALTELRCSSIKNSLLLDIVKVSASKLYDLLKVDPHKASLTSIVI